VEAGDFARRVDELSRQPTRRCFHCHKCTAGCPVATEMAHGPDRLLQLIHLGQEDLVLGSDDIWLCLACETCGTRCPNDIHLAPVMDALRRLSLARSTPPAQPRLALFHHLFLDIVRTRGRMHEAGLMAAYKLRSGDLLGDAAAGTRLFLKGKIPLRAGVARPGEMLRRVFATPTAERRQR
jgi:heterodisulfide reductase subunit C